MKRRISDQWGDYKRDSRGATAIIYGLCLLPLLMLVGFAIDGARINTSKEHLQASVDAGVLAGAREFLLSASEDSATQKANARAVVKRYVLEDVATADTTMGTPDITIMISETGAVSATAVADLPLVFGGLFSKEKVALTARGSAQAGDSRKIEVILALDNTTSMFEEGRFTKMREASKGFVNTMFDETPAEGLMSIGVVPWAAVVNINSETPNGWTPASVTGATPPVYGSAKTPGTPFEDRRKYLYEPEDERAYSAAQMAKDFAPVDWRGCIRAAPNERRVSSSGVVLNKLTDDPVSGMRWHASRLEPENHKFRIYVPKPPRSPRPTPAPRPTTPKPPKTPKPPRPRRPGPQGSLVPGYLEKMGVPQIDRVALDIHKDYNLKCSQSSWQSGYKGVRNVYLSEDTPCATSNKSGNVRVAKACVSDPNEFAYFSDGEDACAWQRDIFPWDETRPISGPNMNCPTAMLGLSGDRGQIIEKLDHMYPVIGGTQADIGLMWGLRALSPRSTWTGFFGHTGAKAPKAFKSDDVRKIMILLTDGQNVAPYDFEGYYGCTEGNSRGDAGRCFRPRGVSRLDRASLDGLTLDSCKEIRETYGIELYTIAVDITDSDAIDLLGDCAANAERTFNITAAELDTTFSAIAARELRLIE